MKSVYLMSAVAFEVLAAGAAMAQAAASGAPQAPTATSPAASSAPSGDTNAIQDIVVTAERRSARLQDVPIAITAATAPQLKAQGVNTTFDVGKITPGLNSNQTGGFGTPIMRGVGTTNVAAGDEPSVATYIDGFYQGSGITAQIPFNNVDRIEVLKGPQGTLYGRNATGGLINIITRQPTDIFDAEGSVTYGNYDTVKADGYVTGALAKGVDGDIAATYQHQGQGFYRDLLRGGHVGKDDYGAVRGKLRFDLGGDNSLTLGGSYVNSHDSIFNVVEPFPGTTPLPHGAGVLYPSEAREYAGSNLPKFIVKEYSANATLKLDLGFANFVSLSQWRKVENTNITEGDGTSADGIFLGTQLGLAAGQPAGTPLTPQTVAPVTFSYYTKQNMPYFVTQELQLLSKSGGPFSWIVGGFFQDSKDGYHPLLLNYSLSEPPFGTIVGDVTTRALAGYAQGTYKLADGFSFTGGVRYSSEHKHIEGETVIPSFSVDQVGDQSKTFNSFTYRAAVDYRINPQLLLYATANKGFKSGTFTGNSPTAPAVKPEILYAYEAGFKADPAPFVRINASGYYYNYKDIQTFVNTSEGLSLLQNAASAHMYGMELSAEVQPARGFNITAGMGYEHARYQSFPDAAVYLPSPSGGNYPVTLDVSGNQVIRTPALSGNLLLSYKFDVGNAGMVELNSSTAYSGDFYWDSSNLYKQKAYALLDLSATFTTADKRWSVRLWGKNVTNKLYANFRNIQQRFDGAAWGDPATYGVTLGAKF